MNSTSADSHPEPVNPFQAPSIEAIENDAPTNPVAPTGTMVCVCVAAVWGIKALTYVWWLAEGDYDFVGVVIWMIADLIGGATIGLGMALLLTVQSRGTFMRLMPGHWELIAYSPMLFVDLAYLLSLLVDTGGEDEGQAMTWIFWLQEAFPYLLSVILFGLFVRIRETRAWQIYALACLLCYGAAFVFTTLEGISPEQLGGDDTWNHLYSDAKIAMGLFGFVATISFLIAIPLDFRGGVRRDVYHYVGLVLPVIMGVLNYFLGGDLLI